MTPYALTLACAHGRLNHDKATGFPTRLRGLSLEGGQGATTGNYRLKKPPPPGGFVKTEIIEPLGLTVTAAATALGITRTALSTFLNGRSALSPEMALRIEKAFGVGMETLMRMQNSYDISQARLREADIRVERFAGTLAAEP